MLKKIFDFLKKSKIVIILSAIFLAAGLIIGASIFSAKDSEYETIKAEKKGLSLTMSASGSISSDEEATLKFQTAGYLCGLAQKREIK